MQESYREGLASHPGPESCAGCREVTGEALTGVHAGRLLSREISQTRVPTLLSDAEGHTVARVIASARRTRRGRRPLHVWKLPARKPGDLVDVPQEIACGTA